MHSYIHIQIDRIVRRHTYRCTHKLTHPICIQKEKKKKNNMTRAREKRMHIVNAEKTIDTMYIYVFRFFSSFYSNEEIRAEIVCDCFMLKYC